MLLMFMVYFRGIHKSYYGNDFIVHNSLVDQHLAKLGYIEGEVWNVLLVL